jgi:predicted NBD/HSP70 family sugar kinase
VLPALAGWSPAAALARLGYTRVAVVNDVRGRAARRAARFAPGLTAGVVMAGTAVGAAFVAHGEPLLGTSGWAGELGYLPLAIAGEVKASRRRRRRRGDGGGRRRRPAARRARARRRSGLAGADRRGR